MELDTLIGDNNCQRLECQNSKTKRTYKQYPPEFKQEAVNLVLEQDYTVPEAAKSLGITTTLLYKWKEKIEAERSGEGLSKDEREELLKLRKENRTLLRIAGVQLCGSNSSIALFFCVGSFVRTSFK